MEPNIIKINTQTLGDDSESVSRYLQDLVSKKDDLRESVAGLNEIWSGDAYDMFAAAVNEDLALLQTVIDNLTHVYQFEQTAKWEYENCEEKVARLIDDISIKEV